MAPTGFINPINREIHKSAVDFDSKREKSPTIQPEGSLVGAGSTARPATRNASRPENPHTVRKT